jgi:hypothetical protein
MMGSLRPTIAAKYSFISADTHIRETEGFLTVVLYLELVLLVEFDLAYRRQLKAACRGLT